MLDTSESKERSKPFTGRLVIDCADRPGIVAAVSGFLYQQGANIVSSHQYSSDPTGGHFYLRTEFFLPDLEDRTETSRRERFHSRFDAEVASPFAMAWRIRYREQRQRVAILVSRQEHCLLELLWRSRHGDLDGEIVMVISNHPDLESEVSALGLPYHHVPVEADRKAQAEQRMLELLAGRIDLLVLARYMQVLSGEFLDRLGVPAINIHHSFLPAFAGADPYRRARERGVKLIGATAHYLTEELDAGPIIEQDVIRVDHCQSVEDLRRLGRDIERLVLARALALHLDDRVIADAGRTIVF